MEDGLKESPPAFDFIEATFNPRSQSRQSYIEILRRVCKSVRGNISRVTTAVYIEFRCIGFQYDSVLLVVLLALLGSILIDLYCVGLQVKNSRV